MEQYKCFALQDILQFSTTIIRVIAKTELPFRMVGVEERLQGFQERIRESEEWSHSVEPRHSTGEPTMRSQRSNEF